MLPTLVLNGVCVCASVAWGSGVHGLLKGGLEAACWASLLRLPVLCFCGAMQRSHCESADSTLRLVPAHRYGSVITMSCPHCERDFRMSTVLDADISGSDSPPQQGKGSKPAPAEEKRGRSRSR